jgi:signal transduction histidine kinase
MVPLDSAALRYLDPTGSSGESASFSTEEQRVLDRINQKIAAKESLEQLVDYLFAEVQPIVAADRVGVSFVEEDGARLVAHYARAHYEPLLLKKGYAEDLNGSSLEAVLRSGRPRIIDDLERYLADHPLKSPLASIVMDVSVLDGGYLGEMAPEQRDRLGRMRAKADYLLNLIREYLDLARVEGGELTINPQTSVDLVKDIVEPACDIVAAQADEKKMRVDQQFPDQPVLVTCDPELLKIVAVNFVGNAVKYGRDGGVVRVSVEQAADRIAVVVWNEGPGFPASQRGRLFRKFSRLDTVELKKRKGTGVGLYTSWRIVRLHGGRVDATSQEGAWAEFRFEIPQPLPSPESAAQAARSRSGRMN